MQRGRETGRTIDTAPGAFKARSAAVATSDWKLAIDLVVADLLGPTVPDRRPDILLVFASDTWHDRFPTMLASLQRRTGAGAIIGGSASGVVGVGQEHESEPALSCLALWLPGVTVDLIRLHQESIPLLDDPDTWHATTRVDPAMVRGGILLADPFRMDAHLLVKGFARCYPGLPLVGGMTSGLAGERRTWVFLDDQVYDEGGVAMMLSGPVRLLPMVSQGCEPVGEPWTITRADRNVILEISGRPAMDVLLDTVRAHGTAGDRSALPFGDWKIGFAIDEYRDGFGRGDFLIRGMLGADSDRRGIVVGGAPRVGQTVQFQLRDAAMAGVDLHQHLLDARAALREAPAAAAVLFTCNGRGQRMFGQRSHDAQAVRGVFRSLPLAGMFCNGEIGPADDAGVALHSFTATAAFIAPDPPPVSDRASDIATSDPLVERNLVT